MLSGIQRFLANGTGPLEFRSALRRKTSGIREFERPIEMIKTLQARIPLNVSGGEIVELMSRRLRQLLHTETPEKSLSLRKDRSNPVLSRIGNDNSKGKDFPNQPAFVKEAAARYFSGGPTSGNRTDLSWITDSNDESTKTGAWPSLPPESRVKALTKTITSEILPERFPLGEPDSLPARSGSAPLESSVFVRKLQQYAQSVRVERDAPEPDSRNRPVPGLIEKKPPVLPASSREERSAGSWYEMPGQEVAERLRAFTMGNGNLPLSTTREFSSGSSEPVRVQNVFHIEVQGQGTGDPSFGDLPTRVADILREQAVQHGIDLT
jgi:hypothetical protein